MRNRRIMVVASLCMTLVSVAYTAVAQEGRSIGEPDYLRPPVSHALIVVPILEVRTGRTASDDHDAKPQEY